MNNALVMDYPAELLDEDVDVLTAAAGAHTGAMIALVPSEADLARLALENGEPLEELHLTLAYLGEAAEIDEEVREKIIESASQFFTEPVNTQAFSVNVFNPHNPEMETAVVLGIGGKDIEGPRGNIVSTVRGFMAMPEQHSPWLPHVTLRYTDDFEDLAELVSKLGPITFDTLRFAFAGEVTDVPLGTKYSGAAFSNTQMVEAAYQQSTEQEEVTAMDEIVLGVNWEEMDLSRLPGQLKKYWLGPKGSARVGGWGNEGSFRACQREMRKEGVPKRMIDGLCANLYHAATGHTPNQKKISALTADGYSADESASYAAWEGVLTLEGIESGDGRLFSLGSLDWAETPLPLMYQPSNTGGHSGSVLVGQITNVYRKNNQLYGTGVIDLNAKMGEFEVGKEVHRLMAEELMNGVSVDVDRVKDADVRMIFDSRDMNPGAKPRMTIFDRGRVRGATLVAFPAFTEAQIFLTDEMLTAAAVGTLYTETGRYASELIEWTDDDEGLEVLAAAARSSGWSKMPIADDSREWDKGEAVQRLVSWAGDDISGKYARAFLYKNSEGDPNLQGSYKFPIADVIDGTLTIVPNAVRNAAARLEGSDIPDEDKTRIRATLERILDRVHGPMTASGHTITFPELPPAWWFERPTDVPLKGALTVTDEGRVYGLLAPKNTTHRAVKTKVPVHNVDYSRFMKGETLVDGGGRVVTGVITMNCGHAPTENYGTLNDRITHYDNSCSVVADVVIGEYDGEVWVGGAAKPWITPEQFSTMMSCVLSGDWQPHPDRPGIREFVAALLVPVPGFAMARTEASVQYEDGTLVASAVPVEFEQTNKELLTAAARKKELMSAKLRSALQTQKAEMAARIMKGISNV